MIALVCVSDDLVIGEVINDGVIEVANDSSFSSTALFITLLTLAGITVVDGSTVDFCFFRLANDISLSFATESAFPARSPRALAPALIPLSRMTSMAFIDNCLASGATFGTILVNNPQ